MKSHPTTKMLNVQENSSDIHTTWALISAWMCLVVSLLKLPAGNLSRVIHLLPPWLFRMWLFREIWISDETASHSLSLFVIRPVFFDGFQTRCPFHVSMWNWMLTPGKLKAYIDIIILVEVEQKHMWAKQEADGSACRGSVSYTLQRYFR